MRNRHVCVVSKDKGQPPRLLLGEEEPLTCEKWAGTLETWSATIVTVCQKAEDCQYKHMALAWGKRGEGFTRCWR